jgi:hypothetical protein
VPALAAYPHSVLTRDEWTARRPVHECRIDALVGPHLARRRHGETHPVEDFLFTYYSFRPGQLRRWHPGFGVVLDGAVPDELGREYVATRHGSVLDHVSVLDRRSASVAWIRQLLERTAARAPQYGCFGLHEWAMVYRQDPTQVRHRHWSLRLGSAGTDEVVEASPIRCSHFDAYRFFTDPARPLNTVAPSRDRQADLEQPGCLHANMDLYKWAYKLSPLIDSELVADAFVLAREIREVDMRASPYDLSALGLRPIAVETREGKTEYTHAQRALSVRAGQLRARLLDAVNAATLRPDATDRR